MECPICAGYTFPRNDDLYQDDIDKKQSYASLVVQHIQFIPLLAIKVTGKQHKLE
jgi:hypothetical protein